MEHPRPLVRAPLGRAFYAAFPAPLEVASLACRSHGGVFARDARNESGGGDSGVALPWDHTSLGSHFLGVGAGGRLPTMVSRYFATASRSGASIHERSGRQVGLAQHLLNPHCPGGRPSEAVFADGSDQGRSRRQRLPETSPLLTPRNAGLTLTPAGPNSPKRRRRRSSTASLPSTPRSPRAALRRRSFLSTPELGALLCWRASTGFSAYAIPLQEKRAICGD